MTPGAIVASIRVTRWRPLATAMVVGSLYALLGAEVTAIDRLAASAAAVAAMVAFVIDDPAAITIASTPPSLFARRMSRVLVAVVALAAWWTILVATAQARFGPLPVRALSIQLTGLVAIAVAVAAAAAAAVAVVTERDGLAGASATMIAYGLTLAPLPSWSPMPRSPGTAGTATRWLAVTAISAAVFLWTSRDPASNRWHRPTPTFG